MFSIIYLEQKLVTRDSLKLIIEKQDECKVIFSSGSIDEFCDFIKNEKQVPDLCIIADSYNYFEIVEVIKCIKMRRNHPFILLKSDSKFMRTI